MQASMEAALRVTARCKLKMRLGVRHAE